VKPSDDTAKAARDRLIADLKRAAAARMGKAPRPRRAVAPPVLWIRKVRLSPQLMRPFDDRQLRRDELRKPTGDDFALQARTWNGEALCDDEMPSRLWHGATLRFAGALPAVLSKGRFACVQDKLAALLRLHDLGDTVLRPVELVDGDWETILSRDHLLLYIRNPRPTLDIVASRSLRQEPARPGTIPHVDILYSQIGEPVDCVGLKGAENGPDLWIDPRIPGAVSLSDALARRLGDAGLGASFLTAPCHRAEDLFEPPPPAG
jgi:hypothetical protein